MEFRQPATWAEVLSVKAEQPQAVVIQGGTDVMVELTYDRHRPPALIDLSRVPELTRWSRDGDTVRLGAGVPYSRIIAEPAGLLPGLAMASRTVGSPQIRNRGSVGGNLGAASPAGDTHPVLLATGGQVVAESVRGARTLPVEEFYVGAKRNALAPDELIREVLPVARGPQQYSKIGTRNAMVIAVAAFGLALPGSLTTRFGDLVAAAASPIDDVRGTARYRAHALSVMSRRSLTCGSCTVYLDGVTVCACLVAAGQAEGLEYADPHAPYGLRGVGEPPTISSGPAVAAAIRAATGLPLTRVPIRPEHLTGTA